MLFTLQRLSHIGLQHIDYFSLLIHLDDEKISKNDITNLFLSSNPFFQSTAHVQTKQ